MNFGIQEHVAIVLAASKGLGKAAALALAQEGVKVVIAAREKTHLENTAKEIHTLTKSTIIPVSVDVTKREHLERLAYETIHHFRHVDILVNNAGGPPAKTFDECTDEDWQHAYELNLLSTIRMTRLVLPYMKKRNYGRIINMVSISAKQPVQNLILSNAIRSGVLGMAKTLSNEVAGHNITVNNILTGLFLTDRIKKLYNLDDTQDVHNKGSLENIVKDIPMKRLGTPEEYGALVSFLASRQAGYITGTNIQIDGGLIQSTW